jgi:hypothetical protein
VKVASPSSFFFEIQIVLFLSVSTC